MSGQLTNQKGKEIKKGWMQKGYWVSDLFWLTLLTGFVFICFLGNRPLNVPDEARYSEIGREMLAFHDFLIPHLNGLIYFEKPPLFYWMQAAALHLFGLSEWACRLPNALMGLLGCLIVYAAGRKLFDRQTGIFAALILSSSLLYFILARMITLDMALSVWIISCLFSFLIGVYSAPSHQKYYFYLMYFFSGLAILTKGLVGVIFPGSIIFLWLCITGNWQILKKVRLISGAILFLVVVLPWHILVQLKIPEFFHFYFIEQQFYRYFTMYADRYEPGWYYLMLIGLGLFPWTGYLIGALKNLFDHQKGNNKDLKNKKIFLWIAAIFILLFYSFSKSKMIPYILPCFPLFAILMGAYLSEIKDKRPSVLLWIQIVVMIGLAGGFIATLWTSVSPDMAIDYQSVEIFSKALMVILAMSSVCVPIVCWKKNITALVMVQFIFSISFMFVICMAAPHIYMHSLKSIALKIKSLESTNNRVVAYGFYYHDLPFYLRQEVILVDWKGELEFGSKYTDDPLRLLSHQSFWSSDSQKEIDLSKTFFVMPKFVLSKFQQEYPEKKIMVLSETKKDILVKINSPVSEHSKGVN